MRKASKDVEGGAAAPFLDRERRGIQSIEVGGEILKALTMDARPMALRELAKAAGMPAGKVHPYLVSFGKIGLVSQDPATGYYLLGPMAIQLGLTSLQTLNPIREAIPFADALAAKTNHSVALSVWANLGPTIVRLIDAGYPVHTNIRTGTVMSLANTATGRVFCAFLPRQLTDRMLKDDYIRLGPDIAHPLDSKVVETLIDEARDRQMSRGINHPTPGIASLAAPVFDYSGNIALAVTIMGPTGIFDPNWDGVVAKALRTCTTAISRRLGYAAPLDGDLERVPSVMVNALEPPELNHERHRLAEAGAVSDPAPVAAASTSATARTPRARGA